VWESVPTNPIPVIDLRLNGYSRLKDNELENYTVDAFVKAMNQANQHSHISITHYAGEPNQPSFEWVQKVSEILLLGNIKKTDAGMDDDIKLHCYDRYIEFCKTNKPKDRKYLDEILFKKGVLTGKISQTATIEAKNAYIMQTYQEISELKQLAHEKQREIEHLKKETAFIKQKYEQQKKRILWSIGIGILLVIGGIAYYSQSPKTVMGITQNEGEKLIQNKIYAFNESLKAARLHDGLFTEHQEDLIAMFSSENNQVTFKQNGQVDSTSTISNYIRQVTQQNAATPKWTIDKIEKLTPEATDMVTHFKISFKNEQSKQWIRAECVKDSLGIYKVKLIDIHLIRNRN
jgi:hypothetical protein